MKLAMFNKAAIMSSRWALKLKKASPHILTGLGVVGVGATAIAASKATLKVDLLVDEAVAYNAHIKSLDYDNKTDKAKDRLYFYGHTAWKFTKLYTPTLIIGGLTVSSIIGGHRVLHQRNVILGASYAALDSAYKKYRETVVERFGEDVENEIRTRSEFMSRDTNESTDDITKEELEDSPLEGDPYIRLFDELNPNWQRNADMNLHFLKISQAQMNDKLRVRGHVFLNDVFDQLGMPRTPAGAVTGWVRDNPHGDGEIDFGLYKPANVDFLNGHERSVWLEFNVDGVVYDQI